MGVYRLTARSKKSGQGWLLKGGSPPIEVEADVEFGVQADVEFGVQGLISGSTLEVEVEVEEARSWHEVEVEAHVERGLEPKLRLIWSLEFRGSVNFAKCCNGTKVNNGLIFKREHDIERHLLTCGSQSYKHEVRQSLKYYLEQQ